LIDPLIRKERKVIRASVQDDGPHALSRATKLSIAEGHDSAEEEEENTRTGRHIPTREQREEGGKEDGEATRAIWPWIQRAPTREATEEEQRSFEPS